MKRKAFGEGGSRYPVKGRQDAKCQLDYGPACIKSLRGSAVHHTLSSAERLCTSERERQK